VKQILFFILCVLGLFVNANAQIFITGKVLDSMSKAPLASVIIENSEMKSGTQSLDDGTFTMQARLGDHFIISMIGKKTKVITISEENVSKTWNVLLANRPKLLKPIIIKNGPSEYQKDSANRANIYADVIQYEKQSSFMSPVTSLYQKFSKKHKDLQKLQIQIIKTEQQKFIDTRYTPELVASLTKLSSDSVPIFMNAYPMEFEYARAASELEIKMWIKYNLLAYTKPKQLGIQKRK
jgi:CarboxypepD_reg-like domain